MYQEVKRRVSLLPKLGCKISTDVKCAVLVLSRNKWIELRGLTTSCHEILNWSTGPECPASDIPEIDISDWSLSRRARVASSQKIKRAKIGNKQFHKGQILKWEKKPNKGQIYQINFKISLNVVCFIEI